MNTTVITQQKLQTTVHTIVREYLQEILQDTDFGLRLTPRAERRLRLASRAGKRAVVPASEVIKRLGLSV